MFKVTPSFELPEGYELWDDEDFVYLYKDGECVATFNALKVMPENILADIRERR